jgi:tRNA-splicing ligase RtcB
MAKYVKELKSSTEKFSDAEIIRKIKKRYGEPPVIPLRTEPGQFKIFPPLGIQIEPQAINQLETAMRLPVASQGAGMPDMHQGYALPIGGVVALDGAISPGFVGYDIGCRMHLTILRPDCIPPELLKDKAFRKFLLDAIKKSTSFGLGATSGDVDHAVMHDPAWDEIKNLGDVKAIARTQLGSQGAGNHFADLLVGEVLCPNEKLPPMGTKFVALLTHSGSRKAGNIIGHKYAKIAEEETKAMGYNVPKDYGFLMADRDSGREYLIAMELMGAYAQANHEIAHAKFLKLLGAKGSVFSTIQNHHNFAWLENGRWVHRKGATPAGKGVLGVIPGSSGTASYIAEGKGNPESINSASHGAGRPRSRSASKKLFDESEFIEWMNQKDIWFHGVAADETYKAYKDIEAVMDAQTELVEPIARMHPNIVVMGGKKGDDGD